MNANPTGTPALPLSAVRSLELGRRHRPPPGPSRPRAPVASAFTLIELLVVIAIIALLIAMLLPAIKSARRLAQVVVCQSQFRQIGVGIHAYAADHGASFPQYTTMADAPYQTTSLSWNNQAYIWGRGGTAHRLLEPYLTEVLPHCPLDEGYQAAHGLGPFFDNKSFYDLYGTSYVYNIVLNDGLQVSMPAGMEDASAVLWGSRWDDIEFPSKLVMAADFTLLYYAYFTYDARPSFQNLKMHDLERNVLAMAFVDGHVATREMRDGSDVSQLLFNDDYQLVRPGYFE